jgi:hypothetical protein
VEKAEGVFLWVFLVIRSLKEGITNNDNADQMKERLHNIPSDLESLFRHMLDGVDAIYYNHMAKTLQVARLASSPLR